MLDLNHFATFLLLAFLYIIIPGPAILLAVSNGLTAGMKDVCSSSFGHITGLVVTGTISVIGAGTILQSSAMALIAIKGIGSLYLVYLGVKRISDRYVIAQKISQQTNTNAHYLFDKYKEGFFLSLFNPKPVVFFVAVFPQFISPNDNAEMQFSIMLTAFMIISYFSLMSYGFFSKSVRFLLKDSAAVSKLNLSIGLIFIVAGLFFLIEGIYSQF